MSEMSDTPNTEVNEHSNVDEEVNSQSIEYNVNEDNLMLSTIDNPYSPKTDYDLWKRWDSDNGYNTEEYIARLISMESTYDVDDEFTLNMLTTKAIDDILENDEQELYRLV